MAQSVTVDFNANLARFTNSVDKAVADLGRFQSHADRISGNVSKVLGGIGIGSGLSAGALVTLSMRLIDTADNMNDLAQRTGIAVRELGTWKLAAEQSGTSTDSLARGIKGLSAYMVDHKDKLLAAGITATDANGALIQLADIFAAMPDGITKTNLAIDIFGKGGMDMIPMLNLGSKGLQEVAEKADEYSRRLQELAPKADKFNDRMSELSLQAEAFGLNVANKVIDPLTEFVSLLNELAAGGSRADAALSEMTKSSSPLLAGMASMRLKMRSHSGWQGNGTAWEAAGMDPVTGRSVSTDGGVDDSAARKAEEKAKRLATGKGDHKKKKTFDPENDTLYDIEESVRKAKRRAFDEEEKELDRQAAKYKALADPLQKYRVELDQIHNLRERGLLTTDEAIEAEWQVTEAMDAQIDKMNKLSEATQETSDFARDMGMTFSSAFEDAIVGGKGVSDMLKGLSQDVARVIVRKSITEPLGNAASKALGSINWGKIFSFDGGGDTGDGPRSGGLDGKGGFLSILHPKETVTDHTKLGSSRGAGGTTNHFTVDMRGASVEAVSRLEQLVMSVNGSIERRAMNVMRQAAVRG